ncbi:MAG: hypothetical protein ACYC5O_03990 [Anaerolineae bacterium]
MTNDTLTWLLQGPPWARYRTLVDLLGRSEADPEVVAAKQAVLAHPQVQALLAEVAQWPGPPLKRHNDAGHPLHKLAFLADVGLRASDAPLQPVVERVLSLQAPEGAFRCLTNVSPSFGGSGSDTLGWMLCDAPLTLYSLARLGLEDDARVQQAAAHLAGLCRDNGWPCAVSAEAGRFRGPGSRADPCPYATLASLQALSALPDWRDHQACHVGAEALLTLWKRRRERRPYLFAMGTDFAKLKAPLVWYDILHVTDVFTRFPRLRSDPRLREMVGTIGAKADGNGRFTPESVWLTWKQWDFGQKKQPSPWLTYLAWRVIGRCG